MTTKAEYLAALEAEDNGDQAPMNAIAKQWFDAGAPFDGSPVFAVARVSGSIDVLSLNTQYGGPPTIGIQEVKELL